MKNSVYRELRKMVRFGVVGASNVGVSYAIYALVLLSLHRIGKFSEIGYLIAQAVSFFLSVLWSFFWHRKSVFMERQISGKGLWTALVKEYVMYSFTGLLISGVLLTYWIRHFHISEFVAPIINLVVTVPLNYLLARCWVFKEPM